MEYTERMERGTEHRNGTKEHRNYGTQNSRKPPFHTELLGGLEHLKIETRLIDERFASVRGECVM